MKETTTIYRPTLKAIEAAAEKLKGIASVTPLTKNVRYSKHFDANIYFKREDLQNVRSYKIRGAYNKISSLNGSQIENGIVCASAGNHAGGLASGLSSVFRLLSPQTKIIGVEPKGAAAMLTSIRANKNITLNTIDNFVDGAAVKRVGDLNFAICKEILHRVVEVDEGKICQTILELYNKDAIVAEPAGVLSLSALEQFKDEIKGKNVVCIISGSNNDITRTAEIKERALLYANLKHYFIIKFPQRAGALRDFVVDILGPTDDITHFEYTKKANRENEVAVVGLELKSPEDLEPLITKMKLHNFYGDYLNDKPDLFQFLV